MNTLSNHKQTPNSLSYCEIRVSRNANSLFVDTVARDQSKRQSNHIGKDCRACAVQLNIKSSLNSYLGQYDTEAYRLVKGSCRQMTSSVFEELKGNYRPVGSMSPDTGRSVRSRFNDPLFRGPDPSPFACVARLLSNPPILAIRSFDSSHPGTDEWTPRF